jgi:hypothetical protein
MPEQIQSANGDPSGVPRPVDPERIPVARANSGIMVGEQATSTTTTAGTQQDQYKTAFIKVYQDAGVIGVAMLTMLAISLISIMFSTRVLKMYSTLVTANTALVSASADATLKIATAMTLLDSTLKSSVNEFRREHDATVITLAEITAIAKRNEERTREGLQLLSGIIGGSVRIPKFPRDGDSK